MATMKYDKETAKKTLSEGLNKILRHETISIMEYMELYSTVVAYIAKNNAETNAELVGSGFGRVIYTVLEDCLKTFIREEFGKLYEIAEEEAQLSAYGKLWGNFEFASKVIDGMFRYLNRHWIRRILDEHLGDGTVFETQTLCMVSWEEVLFGDDVLDISTAARNLLKRIRDGEKSVNMDLLRMVSNTCVAMGIRYKPDEDAISTVGFDGPDIDEDGIKVTERPQLRTYEEYFQKALLENTYSYYHGESAECLQNRMKIVEYMQKTKERIEEEVERSQRYFYHQLTNRRIKAEVEKAFIADHLDFFRTAFMELLHERNFEHMNMMYDLCKPVEAAISELRKYFSEYVQEEGRRLIKEIPAADQNDPKIYVSTIMGFYEEYKTLVIAAFRNDVGFNNHFEEACRAVVNKNSLTEKCSKFNKSAEMLARYVDVIMKKGGNKENEDMETVFDRCMSVFAFIDDKDIFQKYYNRFLARRLLHDTSVNDDSEAGMIARMKQACGHEYTSVCQKMFADIKRSKDLTTQYREQQKQSNKKLELDATFQILGTAGWPLAESYSFSVPPALEQCISSFTASYINCHQGRKLKWMLNQCRGEVTFRNAAKKYTFMVNTPQMVILLAYNEETRYSAPKLAKELNMAPEVLNPALTSFLKADLLRVQGCKAGDAIPDDAEYALNTKFVSKRIKMDLMKLQVVTKSESENSKEQQQMEKILTESRQVLIQAAIVRVMKMRKKLQHNTLVTEVVEQVASRFQPNIPSIKKCIDLLMEKDYIKRTESEKDTYEYIS
ncbi:hypothetical protein L596_012117 [Steinernema carpocapsae]|uniref:Cullin family profile domain-containing protein n=1 Tax=Steinernema carpocapsae TaxID=34508 RepID=A0A4U5NW11_STECR|nr:hypothetical protein L596_012117 [Steinernema carpocapsae]